MTQRKSRPLVLRAIKSVLRILCLVVFFHWMLWITTYAKCINYYDAIKDKEIKKHDEKTERYEKGEGKTITEVEEDILSQIEEKKKKELDNIQLPRKWKEEKLPKLKELDNEIKQLKEKENKTETEKKEISQKEGEYEKDLETAKDDTIKNIRDQLEKHKLDITELNDKRSWKESLWKDPLRFFFISPLHQVWKFLHIPSLLGEIIFKIVVIKLFWIWIRYSIESDLTKNAEKLRDPTLSIEEKEKINEEAWNQFKYLIFNGIVWILFNWFFLLNPFLFDRTNPTYLDKNFSFLWIFPLLISTFLSSIGWEFSRQGKILSKTEIKGQLAKVWMFNIFISLVSFFWLPRITIYGRTWGNYLFSLCSNVIEFFINVIWAWFLQRKSQKKKIDD